MENKPASDKEGLSVRTALGTALIVGASLALPTLAGAGFGLVASEVFGFPLAQSMVGGAGVLGILGGIAYLQTENQ